MSLIAQLAGCTFIFIIITNITSSFFGYQVFNDVEISAKFKQIVQNQKNFKIGFILIILEHLALILVAILMFLAFGELNIYLGLTWLIARSIEGIMQLFNKRKYWNLLNLAQQYESSSNQSLLDKGQLIMSSKELNLHQSQVLFSIGTLAYSIVILTDLSELIGWFGVITSVIYGIGNIIGVRRPGLNVFGAIGGLLILLFELSLGLWLIFIFT